MEITIAKANKILGLIRRSYEYLDAVSLKSFYKLSTNMQSHKEAILANHSAYYRWCTTRHSRASSLQATLELAEVDTTESCSHKDVKHCKISQNVDATGKVVKAITNFINLFDVYDKDNLYCLSSGAPTTKDTEEDLLSVSKVGKEAKSTFIKERLIDSQKHQCTSEPPDAQNVCQSGKICKSHKTQKE